MKKKRAKSFNELNQIAKNEIYDTFIHSGRSERRRILKDYRITLEGTYTGFYRKKNNTVVIPGKKNPFTGKKLSAKVLKKNNIKVSDDDKVLIILSTVTRDDSIKPDDIFTCRIIKAAPFSESISERNYRIHGGLPVYKKSEAEEEKKKEIEISGRKRKEAKEKKTENRAVAANSHKKEETQLRTQKIKEIVEGRKIHRIIHFTRLENLASILENGLIPVSQLKKYGMSFVNNDKNRYDFKEECICTSLEYPNSWVMQRFINSSKDSKWAVLVIDSCVLYENNCMFAEHNAATKEIQKKIDSMNSPEALNNLFKPVVEVNLKDGNKRVFDRRRWPMKIDCFPTSDQAEVLVEGRIVKEKIKTVFFMDRKDASKFRKKCNANNINVNVDEELFVKSRQQYFGC